jgi:hypothetical protein
MLHNVCVALMCMYPANCYVHCYCFLVSALYNNVQLRTPQLVIFAFIRLQYSLCISTIAEFMHIVC